MQLVHDKESIEPRIDIRAPRNGMLSLFSISIDARGWSRFRSCLESRRNLRVRRSSRDFFLVGKEHKLCTWRSADAPGSATTPSRRRGRIHCHRPLLRFRRTSIRRSCALKRNGGAASRRPCWEKKLSCWDSKPFRWSNRLVCGRGSSTRACSHARLRRRWRACVARGVC